MGLQFRKRTKGKDSWFNFSGSKKNGLGASLSVKLGKNVTYNSRGRVTVNFGNGFRYVVSKKKGRKTKDPFAVKQRKTSSRSYTYTPVEYKNVPTQNEILCSVQEVLGNEVKMKRVVHSADLQVIVDLYNAIEFVKEDPDSLDNIDLIVVTTNQLKEVAKNINDSKLIESANVVSDYLRSILPEKPRARTQTLQLSSSRNNLWIWGAIISIIIMVQMCAG